MGKNPRCSFFGESTRGITITTCGFQVGGISCDDSQPVVFREGFWIWRRLYVYFFLGGDQTKNEIPIGGGFERFFFLIFSLDKMIKIWRASFSNGLKPPSKHRVFSQSSDLQKPCGNLSNETRAPELFRLYIGMKSCPVLWAVAWQKWLVSPGFCWPHLLNVHVQSMDFAATSTDDADQISAGKHEYSQDPHSVALIDFRFWDLLMDDFWSTIFWSVMQKIRSQEDSSSQLKNADDQIIQYVFISFYRVGDTEDHWSADIPSCHQTFWTSSKSCFHWGACKLAKPMRLGWRNLRWTRHETPSCSTWGLGHAEGTASQELFRRSDIAIARRSEACSLPWEG